MYNKAYFQDLIATYMYVASDCCLVKLTGKNTPVLAFEGCYGDNVDEIAKNVAIYAFDRATGKVTVTITIDDEPFDCLVVDADYGFYDRKGV